MVKSPDVSDQLQTLICDRWLWLLHCLVLKVINVFFFFPPLYLTLSCFQEGRQGLVGCGRVAEGKTASASSYTKQFCLYLLTVCSPVIILKAVKYDNETLNTLVHYLKQIRSVFWVYLDDAINEFLHAFMTCISPCVFLIKLQKAYISLCISENKEQIPGRVKSVRDNKAYVIHLRLLCQYLCMQWTNGNTETEQ